MQARACDEMTARLGTNQIVLCDTVRIAEERSDLLTYSAQAGAVADQISLNMRAVVEATAIDQQFAQQIAFARLAAEIPRGRTLQPESVTYDSSGPQSIDALGRVGFTILATGIVGARIDAETIQNNLTGRIATDAQTYLSTTYDLQLDTPPTISLNPEWLPQLPFLPFRINVVVQATP
jgi:hypothetical protein